MQTCLRYLRLFSPSPLIAWPLQNHTTCSNWPENQNQLPEHSTVPDKIDKCLNRRRCWGSDPTQASPPLQRPGDRSLQHRERSENQMACLLGNRELQQMSPDFLTAINVNRLDMHEEPTDTSCHRIQPTSSTIIQLAHGF